jgi:V/A-type H+-transporting ATPase subunit D
MTKINPTRMQLSLTRRKLRVAVRSHKLLKDKADELAKRMQEFASEAHALRADVELKIREVVVSYALAKAGCEHAANASQAESFVIQAGVQNVVGIICPQISFTSSKTPVLPYDLSEVSSEFDKPVLLVQEARGNMLRLAELEHICRLLSAEAVRARRRVNSLEYMLIPRLLKEQKYILAALDERERGNIVRMLKIKEY